MAALCLALSGISNGLLGAQDRQALEDVDAKEKAWQRVEQEIVDAYQALGRAEQARTAGETPRPGERLGKVGGGSRLTEAYFARLESLDANVQKAKARLDRAYEERNQLR
ncbi:MAG TPA: hypothetical protein VMJ14_02420 [Burkholderiales bacterium]|nr:hypothetical protein [Burkholderiales bacterium]